MNISILNEFIEYTLEITNYEYININKDQAKEFITDFLIAIDDNKMNFSINLKEMSKWLKVNEKSLRDSLYLNFTNSTDYIKYLIDMPNKKGRPRFDIFVTTNCFKKLCLRSNSKFGHIVRDYFIEIEEAYREYMKQSILHRQRNDKEDHNYKNYGKNIYPKIACVYVIQIIGPNDELVYKIGQTINLKRRMGEHKRQIVGKIKLILYEPFEHHIFLESCLHSFLQKFRKDYYGMTEIFETDLPKITKLIQKCREFRESSDIKSILDDNSEYTCNSTGDCD